MNWIGAIILSCLATTAGHPGSATNTVFNLNGSQVISISSGSYTVTASELLTGNSQVYSTLFGFGMDADNLELGSYFAKNANDPNWDWDLGSWIDINGSNPDFFVFEAGGNDTVSVAARFSDGSLGQPVIIGPWSPTGFNVSGGPNSGQEVFGAGVEITELLDGAGVALTHSTVITGLRVISATIDGCSMAAVNPMGAVNLPPQAEAGPSQFVYLPQSSATLNGSASFDPESGSGGLQYAWAQVDGPNTALVSNAFIVNPMVTGLVEGNYEFELVVTDPTGATDSDLTVVNVLPATTGGFISGELRKWHRITFTFSGPTADEATQPNPFLDYRLRMNFSHPLSGKTHVVEGFFAADGNAAFTHATSGDKWRAHFMPDEPGLWNYQVEFYTATDVSISDDPTVASTPVAPLHGSSGSFTVLGTDKTAPDFRGRGLLRYRGRHHLAFAETGEFYLKGGADSPENFLGYYGFDNTYDNGGVATPGLIDGLHRYPAHAIDWNPGDPNWTDLEGDDGKNIIGALNYLAGQGVNSVYFLTYNIHGGDGQDTWPWITVPGEIPTADQLLRYDCSKLDQWEIVFSHMDRLGIQLHLVTQETENDYVLNGDTLGIRRRLYYRELVSRFGHHHALSWNIGEENTNTLAAIQSFAEYIRGLDPYEHQISVHTLPNAISSTGVGSPYSQLYGDPNYEATSLQGSGSSYNDWAISIRENSAASARPWAVYGDEQGPWPAANMSNHADLRRDTLWGNLCGGGAGIEWYFGYQGTFGDVQSEDFTVAEPLWIDTRHALALFHEHLRFWSMTGDNALVSGADYCLAKTGQEYLVYAKYASAAPITLDLGTSEDSFSVGWYNPRNGDGLGALLSGSVTQVSGPGVVNLGLPPYELGDDWACVVSNDFISHYGQGAPGSNDLVPQIDFESSPTIPNAYFKVTVSDTRPFDFLYLLIGLGPDYTPVGAGNLLVMPETASYPWVHYTRTDGDGTATMSVPLANNPAWDGLSLYFQGVVIDTSTEGRVGLTAGLEAILHL